MNAAEAELDSQIPRLTSGSVPLYSTHNAFHFSHPLSYEHVFYQRSFRHTWKYILKYILLCFQDALPYLPPHHLPNPPTIQPPHHPLSTATHPYPTPTHGMMLLFVFLYAVQSWPCSSHQVCTRKYKTRVLNTRFFLCSPLVL